MGPIKIEEAIFAVDRALARGNAVADMLVELAWRLRAFLPSGPGADLTRPIDELARALRVLLATSVDGIRDQIMACGLPSDDVACTACSSLDFSNSDCGACAAVRSDGLQLDRRLSGWTCS